MKTHLLFCVVGLTLLTACRNEHPERSAARERMEQRGQEILREARRAYSDKNYDGAQQILATLRKECPLAFDARSEGILLSDSIHLQETLREMLSTDSILQTKPQGNDSLAAALEEYNRKYDFYRRKLRHDRDTLQGGSRH